MANGKRLILLRRTSSLILILGTAFFALALAAVKQTDNRSYIPLVIVGGAVVVPAAFVSYIYEREPGRDIPTQPVILCFLWGGIIGVTIASILEYATLRGLGTPQLLGIGLVEESAKLVFPLGAYFHGRYRSEADGLIFGVATGMGFAALETIGYGFAATRSSGGIDSAATTLIVRSVLSPAGHSAWTGLVCATLWREREKTGRRVVDSNVVGAFAAAVSLHVLWDIFNTSTGLTLIEQVGVGIGGGVIFFVSLTLLFQMVNEAARRRGTPDTL